jgi:hypothetical protein
MVSAVNSAQLSNKFTYKLYQREKLVLAVNSAQLSTVQIHLLPVTAGEDGVTCQLGSALYSADSLTHYNSQRRWRQLPTQLSSLQRRFTYTL